MRQVAMRARYSQLAALTVWLAAPAVLTARQAAPVPAQDNDPVEVAMDHTRNLEYGQARQQLESWLAKHPGDLRALNYLASTMIQSQIFEREMADGRLVSGSLRKGDPPVSEEFRRELFRALDRAEAAANDRLRQNASDQEALYWIGITYMIRSVYQIGFAHSNTSALKDAKQARNYHVQLQRLNPSHADARLLPGMYDYIAGSIPWYMKILTTIIGLSGNKQRGLAAMERAAKEGTWSKVEARQFLAIFYFREKRYGEANALMEQLSREYPRNFVYFQHIARTYKTQNNWRKAAETYEMMANRYSSGTPGYHKLPVAKTLYLAGEAYARAGDLKRAEELYAEAERRDDNNIFVYRAALAAGGVDQQMRRIEEARRRFQRVATAVPATDEGKAAIERLKKLR